MTFTLQFFANAGCTPPSRSAWSGVATVDVTTDANGNALPTTFAVPLVGGGGVTATATGPEGTSELSACVPIVNGAPPPLAVPSELQPPADGGG